MNRYASFPRISLLLFTILVTSLTASARLVSFNEGFKPVWTTSHLQQVPGGAIQLTLDRSSGASFASKYEYQFGRVSTRIKLVPGDSAGVVVAFYMASSDFGTRDELDFEFLGNRTGQPVTVQTNIYANGKGGREQRVNLWFDPSADYHLYTILWNHHHIVFYVDNVPIRVYRNHEARGIPFPKFRPMGIYSSLWDADDWATRGGMEKTDWSNSPFYASYKDFDIDGCAVPGPANCISNAANPWEASSFQALNPIQNRLYRWVRTYRIIYDYCTDKTRYAVAPAECTAGL